MDSRTFKTLNLSIDFLKEDIEAEGLSHVTDDIKRLTSICYVKGDLNKKEFEVLSNKISAIIDEDKFL